MENKHMVELAKRGVTEIRVVHVKSLQQKLFDVAMFAGVLWITWKMMSRVLDKMNQAEGDDGRSDELKKKIIKSLNKAGRKIKWFHTNTYEDALLEYVTLPNQMTITFDDIGGLGEQKQSIRETILLPLKHMDSLRQYSALLCPPTGVLFYGPPGTGKTLMAKAIAKTAASTFIYLKISAVMSKWYGETSKLITAVFTLAQKLAPTIIFIDELDAFLGKRRMTDQTADAHSKALFLSLWDGLSTTHYQGVIVLGCSNRPYEIDEAILRRMPRQYQFDLPEEVERTEILDIFLNETLNNVDTNLIASKTEAFSGSDLRELCKVACSLPLQEALSQLPPEEDMLRNQLDLSIRVVNSQDFVQSLQKVKPSWVNAESYRKEKLSSDLRKRNSQPQNESEEEESID